MPAKVSPQAAFTKAVTAASRKSSSKAIASALGELVKARLKSHQRPKPEAFRMTTLPDGTRRAVPPDTDTLAKVAFPRRRRSLRRRGRNQSYRVTAKVDISRLGTFRHYMLTTIRKHTSTWDAENEHEGCDNPKFAKNKLDFSWAAAEGYIRSRR